MDTLFNLNWLRESASGHLDADLGTVVPASQLELGIIGLLPGQQPGTSWGGVRLADLKTPCLLPEWALRTVEQFFGGNPKPAQLTLLEGFCNRIRDKAWQLERCDLFLPYFGRREWNGRLSVLTELGFELRDGSVVALGSNPHSMREIAMRAAAGVFFKTQTAVPVRFESRLPLVAPWRTLLLERYGLELPAGAPALSRLILESPGTEFDAWPNTPRERQYHYYGVFSHLAYAIQYSLRRWTLAAFALTPDDLADHDSAGDLLVYAAVRPHAEKRRRDFSYDVLNSDMMDYAFGRAGRRLEPMLESACRILRAAGREDDAHFYKKRDVKIHAPRLAQRARKRSRVRVMLISESVLIYSLMKFANRLKSLDSAKALIAAVDDLAGDFEERIRKMFFFLPKPDDFATMLFLEASNAIHCAMGGEQALRVRCETVDGQRHEAIQPMSECWDPL